MIQQLLGTGLTVASLSLVGGAIAKKPILVNLGANLAFTSGIAHLAVKQNQKTVKNQIAAASQTKPESNKLVPIFVQRELDTIYATLQQQQKQLDTQRTRQTLTLSKVSKINHQQKVTAVAISQQVDQLIDLAQNTVITPPVADTVENTPPTTRVYIDGNNFRFALKDMNIAVDYKALRQLLMPQTGEAVFRFYTGVFDPITYSQKRLVSRLKQAGYKVSQLPIIQHPDGTFKTVGDDMKMGTDMIEEARRGDKVVLVTGDGDFIPVVKKLQHKGVKVTVAGHKDSINYELRRIAHHFLDLDTVKADIARSAQLTVV